MPETRSSNSRSFVIADIGRTWFHFPLDCGIAGQALRFKQVGQAGRSFLERLVSVITPQPFATNRAATSNRSL
jgi:hypothetical protein